MMLSSSSGWPGLAAQYIDANLWIAGAPNGTNVFTQLHDPVAQDPLNTYRALRTGNYIAKNWTSGWTVTLEGDVGKYTVVSNDQAGKRYVINISDGTSTLNLRVVNSSGSAQSLTACKICHVDDEADLDANKRWQKDYLSLPKEARILRFLDIPQTNTPGTTALAFSAIPTMSYRTFGNQRWPYELIAELCAQAGADMWLTFPVTCTRDHYRQAAAKIASYTLFTGKIYVEAGNECWNPGFSDTRNYLKDTIGRGTDSDGDAQTIALYNFSDGVLLAAKNDTTAYNAQSAVTQVANAMGLVMSRIWDAFETATVYGAVPGRSRVKRVHAGQAVSFGANEAALWQFDLAGGSGQRLKTMIDVGAIAPYMDPVATAAIPDVSLDGLIRGKNYNNSLSDWADVFKADNTALLSNWTAYKTGLAGISPQADLFTYEDGFSAYVTLLSSQSYYGYTIDTTGFTSMDFGLSIATAFDNGEQVHLHSGYSSPSSALSADGRYYIKKNGTNKLWVFTTQANYLADVNGDHAANLDGAAGTRTATNFTRLNLIDMQIKAMMDSQFGRDVYQDQKDRVHDVLGIKNFMQFADVGGYWLGGVWGLKNTQFSPDTPRTQWFRELDVEPSGLQETLGTLGAKGKRKKIRGPYTDPRVYDEYIKKAIAAREGKPEQNVALAVVQEALVAQIEERQQTGYEEPAALSMENQLLSRLAELESKNKRLVSKVHARQHQIDAQLEEMKQEEDVTRNILILLHEL